LSRSVFEERPAVYDSLTNLALSTNPQTAFKFASGTIERLSDTRIATLFSFLLAQPYASANLCFASRAGKVSEIAVDLNA